MGEDHGEELIIYVVCIWQINDQLRLGASL